VPLSAVDSISPAFEHTKQQLFRPFRFGQWTRVALVGLFAGELSSGGGCSFPRFPHTRTTHNDLLAATPHDWALLAPILLLALIAIPLVWLFLLYVNSRMRFVLFDSVIAKRCELGRMWQQRREPAFQYFLFQIVVVLATMAGTVFLIGVPAMAAFLAGWFSAPRQHLVPLILLGVLLFFAFAAWLLLSIVVHVFTKDFVVPQMALENISAFEGWRRLWGMMRPERPGYAGYAGMKLLMAVGAAVGIGILAAIAIVLLLIPFGGIAAITILAGKVAGLTWNVFTITAAVVAGSVFLLLALYAVSLVSVPVIIFFPAYSVYFFASRYARLSDVLYPHPPLPPPTPILPAPEPIG